MDSRPKKRVLIVDDSVVVRKALSNALSRASELEVAGSAGNGRLALAKIPLLNPDVILLDIEMPEMNGLEALPEIRKIRPRIPIIMFSTLTERGAEATLEALSLGATDYVTKPSNIEMGATFEAICEQLIPKIKALCHVGEGENGGTAVRSPAYKEPSHAPAAPIPVTTRLRVRSLGASKIDIVAVGVSTGGPEALSRFLPVFPADFPLPIVIAQHMPALFTSFLAQRLAAKCALAVRESKSGELLGGGCIWIAPGDYHLVLSQGSNSAIHLRTHQGPRENFCRPSVDVLFRSVAEVFGARALGVVLTGMGRDGFEGCKALDACAARIFVQDEASSVVWGMPGFVARGNLAEKILPLDQLAPEIIRQVAASQPRALQVH